MQHALEILKRELKHYQNRKDESESNINGLKRAIKILEEHLETNDEPIINQ